MAKVEVYKLKSGGTQEVIASFQLQAGKIVGQGDNRFINHLERQGVLDKTIKPPRRVYPKDGERFLNCLKKRYSSGYLVALEVR